MKKDYSKLLVKLRVACAPAAMHGASAHDLAHFGRDDQAPRHTTSQHRPELAAGLLRAALDALGSVAGPVHPDDVLGLVFSRFCIGK